MTRAERIDRIAARVAAAFRTFGGGKLSTGNPIAVALQDGPAVFAAGVSVEDVVAFVLALNEPVALTPAGRDALVTVPTDSEGAE